MNGHQVIPLIAGAVCFSVGLAVGIGLAVAKPAKVRHLAGRLGRPDYNEQWFYAQTVDFHKRMDACVPDGSVLFIGDSFIQGMCVTEAVPGGINYGIGGDTTEGVISRLPSYGALLRARAVVLAVGDNDLRRGCDESDIVGNYRAILAQIPQNVAIFFCSLTPCSESADAGRMNEKIGKLNRLGAEVCATRPDCYYVDLNSILANEAGCLRTQFADADGVHLNGMGYRVCIEKLRESLAKHASVAAAKAHNVID